MWSGAGPRAYRHWLIKTHMCTWLDVQGKVRPTLRGPNHPLSLSGLLAQSHLIVCVCACVSVCVFVRIVWSGCDLVYVGKRVRVSGIDHASRVWRFVCKSVLSLLLNVRSADDRFGSGDRHTWTCACKYTRHPLAPNMWCNQQPYRGSCGAVTGSLTSPWAFFREGIGQDEWATLVFTPFQSICDICSKWLCVRVGVTLIFILAHSPLCFCAYSTISGPSELPIA